jgi:hypothetical protein
MKKIKIPWKEIQVRKEGNPRKSGRKSKQSDPMFFSESSLFNDLRRPLPRFSFRPTPASAPRTQKPADRKKTCRSIRRPARIRPLHQPVPAASLDADGRQPFMPQSRSRPLPLKTYPFRFAHTRRMRPLSVGRPDNACSSSDGSFTIVSLRLYARNLLTMVNLNKAPPGLGTVSRSWRERTRAGRKRRLSRVAHAKRSVKRVAPSSVSDKCIVLEQAGRLTTISFAIL